MAVNVMAPHCASAGAFFALTAAIVIEEIAGVEIRTLTRDARWHRLERQFIKQSRLSRTTAIRHSAQELVRPKPRGSLPPSQLR